MREENRAEIIQDAMNLLDDELILEADQIRKQSGKRNRYMRRLTAVAASICVLVMSGALWNEIIIEPSYEESAELNDTLDQDEVTKNESAMRQENQEQIHYPNQDLLKDIAVTESLTGIEIPKWEVTLGKTDDNVEVDMIAFFIYEGRCYVQSEYYQEGFSLVGDYVGTSTGLIEEWTKEDGYVDYAGSIAGEFYEVKGYDPEFMLCMKYGNGAVETFIHNNGIVLGKGSDLMEDRLRLRDNFEKVTFKTQKEWNEELREEKNHVLPEEYDTLMNRFIESFCSDDFVYISDTPLDVNGASRYHENMDNYHLTFHTKDGMRFDFVLYEDGYVRFQEFYSVCVQIEPDLYEEIVKVLRSEL